MARIKNLITAFITDTQLSGLCDIIAIGLYNGDTTDAIMTNAMALMMGSLTGSQMITGLGVYNGLNTALGGSTAAMTTLGKAKTVAYNNMAAFLSQVNTVIVIQKAAGKGQASCLYMEYYMANQFFTLTRVGTILGRLKANFTATEWTAVRKYLGSIIFFSKYGL
ncbi:hypothetical protein AAVH_15803 [Aphelenchoides avenae]|nr:hypothetical protein AAVH_15803 [Aphelenchus avenae]